MSEANNKCQHIYGFDEGYGSPDDIEYESPQLVFNKDIKGDERFTFCPRCGKRLTDGQRP